MADLKDAVVDSTDEVLDRVESTKELANELANKEEQVIRRTSYSALPLAEIIRIIDRHGEAKPEFRNIIADMSNWMYDKNMETLDRVVDKLIEIFKANISVHDIIVNIALLDTVDMLRQNGPIYGWQDAPASIVYDNTIQYLMDCAMISNENAKTAPFYALREIIRLIWLVKNRPDRMDLPMYHVTENGEDNVGPADVENADS